MSNTYDIIVVGAGPGGYVCAIRAAQLGMKAAVIEKMPALGGTCLNIGCIPSKALLHASHLYAHQTHLGEFGIESAAPKLNLKQMMAFKQEGVDANTKGVAFLMKKNKIDTFHAEAKLLGGGKVQAGGETLSAKHIVIATGSEPAAPPMLKIDEKVFLSSTGALSLESVPNHLVVVGGGVIGLEMGSVWGRLGANITIIEMLPRLMPEMDGEVARAAESIFKKQGMDIKLGCKLEKAQAQGSQVQLEYKTADNKTETLSADKVLVATGRKPVTHGLGLEAAGVALDERAFIKTDKNYKAAEGIYAIGDVIGGAMLAHKASDEGVALAEMLAAQKPEVNYQAIPAVVYTQPEIASVGLTEEAIKQKGIAYKKGKFPFTANGRAKVNHTAEGFVKILAEEKTDRVLGVHIIGAEAGTMIAEAVIALEYQAAAEDIARICHAHPTLSEAMKEAALAVGKRVLHM